MNASSIRILADLSSLQKFVLLPRQLIFISNRILQANFYQYRMKLFGLWAKSYLSVLVLVIALHCLVAWIMLMGAVQQPASVIGLPFAVSILRGSAQSQLLPPSRPLRLKLTQPNPMLIPEQEVTAPAVQGVSPADNLTSAPQNQREPESQFKLVASANTQAVISRPVIRAHPAIANVRDCAPTSLDYPRSAMRNGINGVTRIRFVVNALGHLDDVNIIKSAGATAAHHRLDQIAVDKLSQCKFMAGNDEMGRPIGGAFEIDYAWIIN